jgi:hypothetical protein
MVDVDVVLLADFHLGGRHGPQPRLLLELCGDAVDLPPSSYNARAEQFGLMETRTRHDRSP